MKPIECCDNISHLWHFPAALLQLTKGHPMTTLKWLSSYFNASATSQCSTLKVDNKNSLDTESVKQYLSAIRFKYTSKEGHCSTFKVDNKNSLNTNSAKQYLSAIRFKYTSKDGHFSTFKVDNKNSLDTDSAKQYLSAIWFKYISKEAT